MRRPHLERFFPNLQPSEYSVESEPTDSYNCIAWAVGVTDRWWWPVEEEDSYWPLEPEAASLEAFTRAFATRGYEPCPDDLLEGAFEKVAIYAGPSGIPTHMARQLRSGVWTSKCGGLEDITHTLEGLEGEVYGRVTQILRRPITES
jgi:hypothetical protein